MTSVTLTASSTRRLLGVRTAVRLRTRAGLAALMGALVVGILGMHTLANHGAPAPVTAATSTAASDTAMTGMSSHDAAIASGTSHQSHDHAAATASSSGGEGHGTDDMTSMVMLCVVMLAAAALTLLVLLAVRILRPLLPDTFAPASVRKRALQWVRGTGPPAVWQFSVIRC